jgi:hypothetical protein
LCFTVHVEAPELLSRVNGFYPLNSVASTLSGNSMTFIPDSSVGCSKRVTRQRGETRNLFE